MDHYTFEDYVGRRMRDTCEFRRRAENLVDTENFSEPEVFYFYNPFTWKLDRFCLCARDLQRDEIGYDVTATRNIRFY